MSKRKPFQNPKPPEHVKSFEAFQGHMVYEQLVANHARKQRIEADAEAKKKAANKKRPKGRGVNNGTPRPETDLTGIAKQLAAEKASVLRRKDSRTYYRGDIRVTMISDTSGIRRKILNCTDLDGEDVELLIKNIDQFPGARLEYDIWTNSTSFHLGEPGDD